MLTELVLSNFGVHEAPAKDEKNSGQRGDKTLPLWRTRWALALGSRARNFWPGYGYGYAGKLHVYQSVTTSFAGRVRVPGSTCTVRSGLSPYVQNGSQQQERLTSKVLGRACHRLGQAVGAKPRTLILCMYVWLAYS